MGPLAPGTTFAGHRIEALVGRGGMGLVYRARDPELDRVVALKVIAPELLDDPQVRARFVREARTAASIEHPNVIPLHYVGEEDGIAFLAMRFVDGEDVRSMVRMDGVLDPGRAVEILAQAAAALDAIHAAGLVHRDVKPANLLVDRDGRVYVTDFGLAKYALSRGGATNPGQWVGTLDYVAPEQIRGGRIDARVDVYALGGVLHFMLTAHIPFDRDSDEAKLWAHLSDPPPRPSRLRPALPVQFDAVVARAMAKDPDARQPSAGDLAAAALAAAKGMDPPSGERMLARGAASPAGAARLPGLVPELSTMSSAKAPPRRGRAPRALLAAGSALAVAGAAFLAGRYAAGDESPATAAKGARHAAVSMPRLGAKIDRVGNRPNGIAVAGGDVWVTSVGRRRLERIDAATGRLLPDSPLVGRGARDVRAGAGAVWVANTIASAVLRIDPATARITGRISTPLRPVALAVGRHGLWVVGRAETESGADALLHYDEHLRLLKRIDVARGVSAITLGRYVVWAAERRFPYVLKVNPRGGRPRELAHLDAPATAIAYGAGYIWALMRDADTLAQIDPLSGRTVSSSAGHRPADVAVAGERVLVTSENDHNVLVFDARTGLETGDPIPVALDPYAIATGLGHVWVTGVGSNSVTRLDG
jgi:streptogramin lyase